MIHFKGLINERKKSSDLPFEKIHWLRIIVDEGNVCANKSAIMTYVGGLRADRRWIVTGTPTTNLITVDTDTSTTSFTSGEVLVEEALTVGKSKSALSQCKEDLNKLNSMICGFLGANVPPMIGGYLQSFPRCGDDESLFKTHVISPSLDGTWGGIKVLENVMSHFLIRHRIEDIEKDVALPPKTRQTVLLDMDPFQAITYNVMLSLVVVNAVDSERADKDYFFHPDNHKFRAILILNLSQTCLWRAERELDNNLTEWLRVSTNSVRKAVALAQQRHGLERDLQRVQQAHLIQKLAASNLAWRCMMRNEQLPFRVYSLPKDLQESWLRIRDPYNQRCAVNQESNVEEESMCFLTDIPDFRQAGQDCRLNIQSMKYEGDIRYESIMKRHGAFRSDYVHTSSETHTLSSPIKALKSKSKSRSRNATKFTSPRSIVSGTAAKSGGFSPSKSARRPAQEAQSILKPVEVGRITSRIYSDNPLLAMRIGGSTSPKINYIISQVGQFIPLVTLS
ncbi:hypothetical protein FRC02_011976 [Tulasnella sp. 418]|nr:hypothetical protein FRC02_011976 [Tulasnella sp. 418]